MTAGVLLSSAQATWAQGTLNQAQATAEQLFEEARQLMANKDYDAACPKLAESQRLDPGGGTVLNLGLCYEAQGKTASAWAAFKEALAYAIRDGRANRETLAREHITQLEPKLNRISIMPQEGADVAGLVLAIDGTEVGRAVWGSPTPVDPGPHTITATAPDFYEWKTEIAVDANTELMEVAVPKLVLKPKKAQPITFLPRRETPPASKPTLMYVGFGVAAAGIATGTATAILALSKRSESTRFCPTDATCSPGSEGVALNNQAITLSWVSTAAFGVGVVGAALGTYLLVKPTASRTTGSTLVVPFLGQREGGLTLTRTF